MGETTTVKAGSPDSIPSLDMSQASTYSTEDDEDSLRLVGEVPANSSSRSGFQYHTLFDIDEEDNISLSSGILSTSSLDLSLEQHSLASMETIKLQNSKEARSPDAIFESVEAEEIPTSRACHGALNITPKQLGEVFALFSSDKTPKQQWPPPTSAVQEGGTSISQSALSSTSDPIPPPAQPTTSASPQLQNDYPMSMKQRASTNITNYRRLSSELFWKPRAKSLEKECASLKEIIHVDSSNIVKLKAAIENLEEKSSRHLAEIQSLKEQLSTATHDLDVLKREREMLLEHETEHRETIRILKHEIDILTRQGMSPCQEKSGDKTSKAERDQEELRQLRLENQLFATQIVEYEADLSCISLIEKEQEQLQERVQSIQRRLAAQSHRSEDNSSFEKTSNSFTSEEDEAGTLIAQEQGQANRFTISDSEEHASVYPFPIPEQLGVSGSDEADAMRRSEERRKRLMEQLLDGDTSVTEEAKHPESETEVDEVANSDKFSSDASSQESLDVLKDHVLGMFTLKKTSEDGKEQDEGKIYVVQEQGLSSDVTPASEIKCLQWQKPESLPTFVKMADIPSSLELEDRNPPVTRTSQGPSCISSAAAVSEFSTRDGSPQRRTDNQNNAVRDGTDIEVLDTGEATEAIEVQLSPRQSFDDNKENEGENKTYVCSSSCDDNCDAWSAVSDCLFFSSTKAQ